MTNRASIFEAPDIDVDAFTRRRPDPAALDEISQNSKFRSRDPVDQVQGGRVPHTYRTGRNITFSAKTTQATLGYVLRDRSATGLESCRDLGICHRCASAGTSKVVPWTLATGGLSNTREAHSCST